MSSILDKTCGDVENGSVARKCLDLPFKLFGTTIATPISTQDNSDKDSTNGEPSNAPGAQGASFENSSDGDHSEAKNGNVERMETDEGSCTSVKINSSSSGSSDHKVSSIMPKKKPDYKDKVLPCPRCDSLETKFCYYNNYNVNQPRHFCKNCQRYWTAGGTLRNVPVGAGRRKNKHNTNANINNNTPPGACTFRNDHINSTHGHAQSINSCFPIPIPAIESAFKSSILSFGLQNYNSNFSATGTQVLYNISKPSWRSTASTSDIGQMGITQDSKSNETPLETDGNWQININANAKTSTTISSHVCNNAWSSHQQNVLWGSALGKRNRSDNQQDTSAAILVPRTLRVDDSQEPVQNTILRNLRMEIKSDSFKGTGIFKSFQSRTEESSDS